MEFDDVIENRRSIRKYKDTPVPEEDLNMILEAGRVAPSAGHRQPWHFIVIQDEETRRKLAGSQGWAAVAPVIILGLGDEGASPNWYQNDLGISFEHMILKATDLGYGTCWMGQTRREDEICSMLNIPEQLRVIAITPIGEPDETPGAKERKELGDIASWESYQE
jgi:nitroreductase